MPDAPTFVNGAARRRRFLWYVVSLAIVSGGILLAMPGRGSARVGIHLSLAVGLFVILQWMTRDADRESARVLERLSSGESFIVWSVPWAAFRPLRRQLRRRAWVKGVALSLLLWLVVVMSDAIEPLGRGERWVLEATAFSFSLGLVFVMALRVAEATRVGENAVFALTRTHLYVDGRLIAVSRDQLTLLDRAIRYDSGDPVGGTLTVPFGDGLAVAIEEAMASVLFGKHA